ncbi:hypothetical protein RvY_14093 [Ramazzottius varieornatus]|uniref:G-protein coupled receptors family 1 profile domain-containing protein n=1 Tax=Ramazzottius varieornatus TaxID=947166 RepID=A0A1D1VXG1_RAMVA|nr:hypothetical protein RvY_14093 [Ramazzottius varieornatus]
MNRTTTVSHFPAGPDILRGTVYFSQAFLVLFGIIPPLVAFANNRDLRSPFNLYIISVLIAELFACLNMVMMASQTLWITVRQHKLTCQAELTVSYAAITLYLVSHLMISVNRMWATFLPVHYRTHHTRKTAFLVCCAAIISVLILVVPYTIRNTPYTVPRNAFAVLLNSRRLTTNLSICCIRDACYRFVPDPADISTSVSQVTSSISDKVQGNSESLDGL